MVMVAHLGEFTNNHRTVVPLKPVSFMAYKFHLNKVFLRIKGFCYILSGFMFHLPRTQNTYESLNCNRPGDLLFIPDEATARPLAQTHTLETAHQLTPQRMKINTQELGSRFFFFYSQS